MSPIYAVPVILSFFAPRRKPSVVNVVEPILVKQFMAALDWAISSIYTDSSILPFSSTKGILSETVIVTSADLSPIFTRVSTIHIGDFCGNSLPIAKGSLKISSCLSMFFQQKGSDAR